MPNHVYNFISVEQEYADKLEAISKVGLAEFFKPRPKAYDDTQSPMPKKKDDPYKYELGKILEKHHGFDNWYDWSWDNCCLLYTSPSPRDLSTSRMPSSA